MLVLDPSVALKWIFEEEGSETADALLSQALIAPDLFQVEVGGALAKSVRMRLLSKQDALAGFALVLSRVSLLPGAVFGQTAFRLSLALHHPMSDCYFLAAAQWRREPLVTADAVFVSKVRAADAGAPIYLLGEELQS